MIDWNEHRIDAVIKINTAASKMVSSFAALRMTKHGEERRQITLEDQFVVSRRPRKNNASPARILSLMCQGRLNKALEEGVRLIRFTLKLWMILAGQEVGMIAQLD